MDNLRRLFAVLFLACFFAAAVYSQAEPPVDFAQGIVDRVNEVLCVLFGILLYITASFVALSMVWAGAEYIMSEDSVRRMRARNRVIYSVIGLVFVLIACPVVNYLVTNTTILPFNRACNCNGQYLGPAVTTTTSSGGSSTTNPGAIATTTTAGSTPTTVIGTTTTGGTPTTGGGSTSSSTTTTTSTATTTSTVPKIKFTLLFIPVDWTGDMASFDSFVDAQTAFLLDKIPLETCPQEVKVTKLHSSCSVGVPVNWNTCYSDSDRILTKIGRCARNSGEKYNYVIGISGPGLCGGRGYSSLTAPVIYFAGVGGREWVTAHELGHQWGLDDEYYDECRCFRAASNGVNCLDASIGGRDPYPGYTSAYCAGGSRCAAAMGVITCWGNKNSAGTRCIMGKDNAGIVRDFCDTCKAHLNKLSILKC